MTCMIDMQDLKIKKYRANIMNDSDGALSEHSLSVHLRLRTLHIAALKKVNHELLICPFGPKIPFIYGWNSFVFVCPLTSCALRPE